MATSVTLNQIAPIFSGRLLQPADAGYDEARRVHNGLIDKRPAIIARCHGTADIADAVKLARSINIEIAVRGGGHNVGGRGTVDGGLMIDLAPMKGIYVDAARRTVRAQGGVLWKELNRETQAHGLATTGGVVGTTGIAGLTLGGGLGWLMPKHGLALDNLRSAEIVLADGTIVRAAADENPDLFWAIRGGGGNFGIAASLEYALHPVQTVIAGGLVAHPVQNARNVLRFFRETCATLPDEMMMAAGLVTAPDGHLVPSPIRLPSSYRRGASRTSHEKTEGRCARSAPDARRGRGDDRSNRMERVFERRRDAKISAAAADGPEEIRIFISRCAARLLGEHDFR